MLSFLEKAVIKHGEEYCYDSVVYVNSKTKVVITCKEHGDFSQVPASHLFGRGCPKCRYIKSSVTQLEVSKKLFKDSAVKKHGDTYDYSKVIYVNGRDKVIIGCKVHGDFSQSPSDHLSGKGCLLCGNLKVGLSRVNTFKQFVDKARRKHGNKYIYSESSYTRLTEPVQIQCKKHGLFTQQGVDHVAGKGCSMCKADRTVEERTHPFEVFKEKATRVHGGRYTYKEEGYTQASGVGLVTVVCKEHGEVKMLAGNHLAGSNCPSCNTTCSAIEKDIRALLSPWSRSSDRTLIKPLELDIVRNDNKVAVEVNGLYWHNEKAKGKNYHKNKTDLCEEKGIRLIHIREDLWEHRKQQVTSLLLAAFKGTYSLHARKCTLGIVPSDLAKEFVDKDHVQGWSKASVIVGLYFEEELVCLASFCNKRGYNFKSKPNQFELVRFCTKSGYRVNGGLSKLIKYFKSTTPLCKSIKSFCDLDLFTGKSYEKAGFTLESVSQGYVWHKGLVVASRYSMQKHRLPKKLEIFDAKLSERENCEANGWVRYYGAGTATYVL